MYPKLKSSNIRGTQNSNQISRHKNLFPQFPHDILVLHCIYTIEKSDIMKDSRKGNEENKALVSLTVLFIFSFDLESTNPWVWMHFFIQLLWSTPAQLSFLQKKKPPGDSSSIIPLMKYIWKRRGRVGLQMANLYMYLFCQRSSQIKLIIKIYHALKISFKISYMLP